jgi:hypothetical protein
VDSTPTNNTTSQCLKAGDEVMLWHLSSGKYEFVRVGGVISATVYFQTERAFMAMDLDKGSLVASDDEQGDIILLSNRSWTSENPNYVVSSLNNSYMSDAYVIETYANHSGVNNLSYEYCEGILQNQTDFSVMGSGISGIACVKTTEGQIECRVFICYFVE